MPAALVAVGAVIVAAAGLFVVWRERQLGLKRPDAEQEIAAPAGDGDQNALKVMIV